MLRAPSPLPTAVGAGILGTLRPAGGLLDDALLLAAGLAPLAAGVDPPLELLPHPASVRAAAPITAAAVKVFLGTRMPVLSSSGVLESGGPAHGTFVNAVLMLLAP